MRPAPLAFILMWWVFSVPRWLILVPASSKSLKLILMQGLMVVVVSHVYIKVVWVFFVLIINKIQVQVQHFSFIHCVERLALEKRQAEWINCFELTKLGRVPIDCYRNGLGKLVSFTHDNFDRSFLFNQCLECSNMKGYPHWEKKRTYIFTSAK